MQKKPERVSADVGAQKTKKENHHIASMEPPGSHLEPFQRRLCWHPNTWSMVHTVSFGIRSVLLAAAERKLNRSLPWIKCDNQNVHVFHCCGLKLDTRRKGPTYIIVLVTHPSHVLYIAVISFKTFQSLAPLQDSGSRVGCFWHKMKKSDHLLIRLQSGSPLPQGAMWKRHVYQNRSSHYSLLIAWNMTYIEGKELRRWLCFKSSIENIDFRKVVACCVHWQLEWKMKGKQN